jgi:kynurenine formamidase
MDLGRMGGVREFCGIVPHGSHTHLDSLAHLSWDGKCYNGFSFGETTSVSGAKKLDVSLQEGIVTRGVVLDIPGLKDKPWLDPGERVGPAELEAAEERQGVKVEEGDALLLYTGQYKMLAEQAPKAPTGAGYDEAAHRSPGYSASCLPWLHSRGISLLSSDTLNDAQPAGYSSSELLVPVHIVALVAMGLWLADHLILEDLVDTCKQLERWEFMFSMIPWKFVGSTSAPVNPLAIF